MKNNIVGGLDDRTIKYLGQTHEGKKHDKKICDEEGMAFPDAYELYQDTGYQGHEPTNIKVHQPTKKPRNGKLTEEEKEANRLISGVRVVIEHILSGIKRCHIVKDVFRNTREGYDDVVMELACGLHNFRNDSRCTSY